MGRTKQDYMTRWLKASSIASTQNYYGKNPDGSYKEFTDSARPKCVSVSLHTLCNSEGKAKALGTLEIGETYREGTRKITRIK
jgi:hypothetical protein